MAGVSSGSSGAAAQGRRDGPSPSLRLSDPPLSLRDVVIVGGGCYGSFYARQMLDARHRGKASFARLLVVDRARDCAAAATFAGAPGFELVLDEWDPFFDRYLAAANPGAPDVVIPSPLMPHLFFEWLARRAHARWPARTVSAGPLEGEVGTPYERRGRDRSTYLSFADWTCPTHCTEPALCPIIRAPRTWEMGEALASYCAATGTAGPALFTVRHLVHGVGGFAVAEILRAEEVLRESVERKGGSLVVGTVSGCHGAAGLLSVSGPGTAER